MVLELQKITNKDEGVFKQTHIRIEHMIIQSCLILTLVPSEFFLWLLRFQEPKTIVCRYLCEI